MPNVSNLVFDKTPTKTKLKKKRKRNESLKVEGAELDLLGHAKYKQCPKWDESWEAKGIFERVTGACSP